MLHNLLEKQSGCLGRQEEKKTGSHQLHCKNEQSIPKKDAGSLYPSQPVAKRLLLGVNVGEHRQRGVGGVFMFSKLKSSNMLGYFSF